MEGKNLFDFTLFYATLALLGVIGIVATIFAGPLKEEMKKLDAVSDGRVHH